MADCVIRRKPKQLRKGMIIHAETGTMKGCERNFLYLGRSKSDGARVRSGFQFVALNGPVMNGSKEHYVIVQPGRQFPYHKVHIPDD